MLRVSIGPSNAHGPGVLDVERAKLPKKGLLSRPSRRHPNESVELYLPHSHSPQSPVDPLPNETSQAQPAVCKRCRNRPQESESNPTRSPNVVEKSDFDSLSKWFLYRFHC